MLILIFFSEKLGKQCPCYEMLRDIFGSRKNVEPDVLYESSFKSMSQLEPKESMSDEMEETELVILTEEDPLELETHAGTATPNRYNRVLNEHNYLGQNEDSEVDQCVIVSNTNKRSATEDTYDSGSSKVIKNKFKKPRTAANASSYAALEEMHSKKLAFEEKRHKDMLQVESQKMELEGRKLDLEERQLNL